MYQKIKGQTLSAIMPFHSLEQHILLCMTIQLWISHLHWVFRAQHYLWLWFGKEKLVRLITTAFMLLLCGSTTLFLPFAYSTVRIISFSSSGEYVHRPSFNFEQGKLIIHIVFFFFFLRLCRVSLSLSHSVPFVLPLTLYFIYLQEYKYNTPIHSCELSYVSA